MTHLSRAVLGVFVLTAMSAGCTPHAQPTTTPPEPSTSMLPSVPASELPPPNTPSAESPNDGTPQTPATQPSIPVRIPAQKLAANNVFSPLARTGEHYGEMVLNTIESAPPDRKKDLGAYAIAQFSGTVTLVATLSEPIQPEGMEPAYSFSDLSPDTLVKLPYFQYDTRAVWFGVYNVDAMKRFLVKSGDRVEVTIDKYYYNDQEAGVYNTANIVRVKPLAPNSSH